MPDILLVQSTTKAYILKQVQELRPGWNCTQVSAEVMRLLDVKMKLYIRDAVRRHCSSGKTFRDLLI